MRLNSGALCTSMQDVGGLPPFFPLSLLCLDVSALAPIARKLRPPILYFCHMVTDCRFVACHKNSTEPREPAKMYRPSYSFFLYSKA